MSDAASVREPVSLVDPHVPADQGLSALGLLMQLAGTAFASLAAIGVVVALALMMEHSSRDGGDNVWALLILSVGVTRSLFHRMAGTELLYGHGGSHLNGTKRYAIIGLVHAALMFMLMTGKFHASFALAGGIAIGLALWPAALIVLLALPRFRRFASALPVAEDKGFESAAILMAVLGAGGAVLGLLLLYLLLLGDGRTLSQGPGVLILLATVMLVIRSFLQLSAGASGLRETNVDRSVELANRYANFGVIASFCAGGAVLLASMTAKFEVMSLALVVTLVWLLLAWPLIVRRFFSERQFADLMAGDQGPNHRRAPDAGQTGLGWLLFGFAMLFASLLAPALFVTPLHITRDVGLALSFLGGDTQHSVWWPILLIVLQAWAGFELVRMSSISRVVTTVYGVAGIIVGAYLAWPSLHHLDHTLRSGPQGFAAVLPAVLKLVIPAAALVLVNRNLAPTAQARFRTPSA